MGNKELREYMEVRSYGTAAEWVYSHGADPDSWSNGEPITLTELRNINRLAMDPVWNVAPHAQASDQGRPGSFRRHDIHPFPEGMQPPSWTDVPSEVAGWLEQVGSLPTTDGVQLPEVLAELHARFEQIHPFLDGNGRTGRLVLNLMLIRLGYPPAIIYKGDRARYLRSLRRADQGDFGALGEFLARAVLDNLYKFVVPAIAGPTRLVPLPVLASSRISHNALRVAAVRGRLKAQKSADGTWRSSQLWVDEYLAERYSRRVA